MSQDTAASDGLLVHHAQFTVKDARVRGKDVLCCGKSGFITSFVSLKEKKETVL